MTQRIFISYSHPDEDVARSLKELLEERGADAWLAADELTPDQPVADAVRKAIEGSSVVVLVIGREPSDWTRHEWSDALRLAWDPEHPKSIVPILVDDAQPPAFLGDQSLLRLDRDDLMQRKWQLPESDAQWLHWTWRTPAETKEKIADRLAEIGNLASRLESAESTSE
jgi:hypothetical protein